MAASPASEGRIGGLAVVLLRLHDLVHRPHRLQENYWEVPQAVLPGLLLAKVMHAQATRK